MCFDKGWRFILADTAAMATPEYHDAFWRQLDVPHDWAIEGDFYVGNPSGAGGGALPGGIGWYRKTFEVGSEDAKSEKFFLEFDGVYMNATVYVNGQKVGYRPYGYSSFEYDIWKWTMRIQLTRRSLSRIRGLMPMVNLLISRSRASGRAKTHIYIRYVRNC